MDAHKIMIAGDAIRRFTAELGQQAEVDPGIDSLLNILEPKFEAEGIEIPEAFLLLAIVILDFQDGCWRLNTKVIEMLEHPVDVSTALHYILARTGRACGAGILEQIFVSAFMRAPDQEEWQAALRALRDSDAVEYLPYTSRHGGNSVDIFRSLT